MGALADSFNAGESVVTLAVLVVVLYVVLEVLSTSPIGLIDENPLGFIGDTVQEASDGDDQYFPEDGLI